MSLFLNIFTFTHFMLLLFKRLRDCIRSKVTLFLYRACWQSNPVPPHCRSDELMTVLIDLVCSLGLMFLAPAAGAEEALCSISLLSMMYSIWGKSGLGASR